MSDQEVELCPYMIFKPNRMHLCEKTSEEHAKHKRENDKHLHCCVLIRPPLCKVKYEKLKELLETKVKETCPLHFTWDEIEKKIKVLEEKFKDQLE